MQTDMTVGKPMKMLLNFTIPVFIGNVFQQLYSMADAVIVGKFVGTKGLAAVGATGTITFLIIGFLMGLTTGFTVLTSQKFGAGRMDEMRKTVGNAAILSAVIAVIMTAVSMLGMHRLLVFMHTPEDIFDGAYGYIMIICAGIFTQVLYNLVSSVLRALGNSKTPLYFLILSSFLNIVLDLFLIVVVKLGTAGAAYATIIAQGVSALLCFIYMFRKFDILKTSREDYYLDGYGVFNMLSIVIPMALNYSITAIGTMILQGAVNIFGSSVVAAFTAASKVENLSTQTMPTLGTAIATYCGQNLGAGKYKRIYEGMRKGFFICIFISLAASAICVFGGRFIVSWFVSNPSEEIFDYAMQYLNTISFFMLPLAWIFLYRNALQGLNRGLVPMLSGVVEMVCRIIVIAVTLNPFGYWAVRLASPITWLFTGILLIVTYFIWEKQSRKKHAGSPA